MMDVLCTACARELLGLIDPGPCPPPGGEWKVCANCGEGAYWDIKPEVVEESISIEVS